MKKLAMFAVLPLVLGGWGRQVFRSLFSAAKKLSRKKSISTEEVDRRVSNASISAADVRRLEAALNASRAVTTVDADAITILAYEE